jgi:hypothetical protein
MTKVNVSDAGRLFKDSMEERRTLRNLAGQATRFETPSRDEVFGSLEEDPPAFQAVAHLSGNMFDRNASVLMQAWDRGGETEIRLTTSTSVLTAGKKAGQNLTKYLAALKAADPTARVTERP